MTNDRKAEYQTAEGKLLETTMRRRKVKAPAVAREVGVSTDTCRNWVKGYRSKGNGLVTQVFPDEFELAAAASFLHISPAELVEAGREDAAAQLVAMADRDVADEVLRDSTPLRRLIAIRDELDAFITDFRASN